VGTFIRAHLPTLLIIQGVLAWAPYVYLKYLAQDAAPGVTHSDVSAMPFLVWHLLGVIPGALLSRRGWIAKVVFRFVDRRKSQT
jgi:hypothetical protein